VVQVATWNDPRYGFAADAERLGVDSLWSPEAWAFDAFTPLAYVAAQTSTIRLGTAIAQLGARTPAMLAMSALSMQVLTHDRFVLGIGTSGPQVMEGWHGVSFDKPIQRTRATIETIRAISSGEKVGRIRSPLAPKHVPIYLASLGPANLRLTGELADGWIGNSFVPEHAEVFFGPMKEAGRFDELDVTVAVGVEITDDEDVFARHARGYAFTFGAMGSKEHNFYVDAFARQGYGDDVQAVQQLWLDGKREDAAARVPVEIGEKTNLLGTPEMITARLRVYRDCGVTTLRCGLPQSEPREGSSGGADLDTLAQLLDLVREVNEEPSVR
jgi:alkanesulfonate monooxygenase SsuD/methylene tetrahydromethanopterin reductase-like flavin-dependent oxidoreductase (luciferase family)